MNVYACYINGENKWVVDGEKGRETYPTTFSRELVLAAYKGECRCYECGKYNITVYDHDIRYKNGDVALVTIDRFDENDNPLDKKSFYLPDGKDLPLTLTESDIDKIYAKKEGSWLYV